MKTDYKNLIHLYYERFGEQFHDGFDCDDFLYACARIVPFLEYHGWTLPEFISEYIND